MGSIMKKKKQRLPERWTEKRVRALAAHHDNQTTEEQAAEIEAALAKKDQSSLPKCIPGSRAKPGSRST